MRLVVPLLALLLAGCASPSPRFLGADPVTIERGGVEHRVYVAGGEAQVIRLGSTRGRSDAALRDLYEGLVIAATGCDPDMRKADLDASVLTVPLGDCAAAR